MNIKYVLAMVGLVMLIVSFLADEGGPVDQLASRSGATDRSELLASSDAQDAPTEIASNDFFSNVPDDDPTEPWGSEPSASFRPQFPAQVAQTAPARSFAKPELGALTKEQLGIEEATGIASLDPVTNLDT